MFGLLAGGLLTDQCSRRFGVRVGRLIPLVGTRFLAGVLFLCCTGTSDLKYLVLLLGLMTFTTDAGLPAMWAWSQDVGGRRVASVLGWANMWGNFGAALQPTVMGFVLKTYDTNHDYHEGFQISAAAFMLAGVLALGINAAKPVEK
jgi:MFS family permease